jgi:hypothetical protein
VLGLAEGIETALSAMQLTGVPVWASLGGARLHRVELPPEVKEVHVFLDFLNLIANGDGREVPSAQSDHDSAENAA